MIRRSALSVLQSRRGVVCILAAFVMLTLLAVAAVSLDGGLLQDNKRRVQAGADAAALSGASALFKNYMSMTPLTPDPGGAAVTAAKDVAKRNGFPYDNDAISKVTVNVPPKKGPFTGLTGYVEVVITYYQKRYFSTIWGSDNMPIQARAVAIAFWGGTNTGILVLDPTAKDSLDASGTGVTTVTGGAHVIVDSNNAEAARVTGGGGETANIFDITGGYTGPLNGIINTGVPPTPDPLRDIPQPTKPAAGTMTTTNFKSNKTYTLTPGSYSNLPNFGNGDQIILKQGGIYYIDGGGLNSTQGATIKMDPDTSNGVGVMIFNHPTGTQQNQGINISGGSVTLSPLTKGPYAGILFWQDRSSSVTMSLQGQGGFDISGTFYAANAQLQVNGQGNNIIGSQYISRTLTMSGGGATFINYTDEGTARKRDIRLVE